MGNGEVLRPGEFQCISAGSGITHSEFNPSATEPVHFYQIWILPNVYNTQPSYQQKSYSIQDKRDRLCLVASPDRRDGSLVIKQDANVYLSLLGHGQRLAYPVPVQRHVWMQLLSGRIELDGQVLESGDGMSVSDETELVVAAMDDSEFMLFDLA
jgi:redox-sensitive bicupin YhaK (pirin superfamily)